MITREMFESVASRVQVPTASATVMLPGNVTPPGGVVPTGGGTQSLLDYLKGTGQYAYSSGVSAFGQASQLIRSVFGPRPSTPTTPSTPSTGNGVTPGSAADPTQMLADLMAQMFGSSSTSGRESGGIVTFPVSPRQEGGGSSMNWQKIIVIAAIIAAGVWAWRKYGSKTVAAVAA